MYIAAIDLTYLQLLLCVIIFIAIFLIKKMKTTKDVLDKNVFAAGIPTNSIIVSVLWFLEAKKQKQVYATRLTYLQLLPSYYNWKAK